MKIEKGNLWDHWERGSKVVVTTNIGWDPVTRENNMGAGMALQAATRWPWLPELYGSFCRLTAPFTPVMEMADLRLIFMPVKPLLDVKDPERSWNQEARRALIVVGLKQLREHTGEIALGLPGCGNGGLRAEDVRPIVYWYLGPRFTLCDWQL